MTKEKGCYRGKASPNSNTKLQLFSDSGGFCQNPDCLKYLFKESALTGRIHIAEMAHIFSASDSGPRASTLLSEEDRGDYSNLILLCPNCHTVVDKAEDDYPDKLMLEWKNNHKTKIYQLFGVKRFENRAEARGTVRDIQRQNKVAFDTYGPHNDYRLNPESEMATKWKSKVVGIIIPNNQKILSFIDANLSLLTEDELITVEKFRQHFHDLKNVHVNLSDEPALQYPVEMNSIFGEHDE